ncbi:SusC/RagA family TonB-linked outer membrane protein [Algoriphagus antarcticus]|uniref:TonB-linked SusC/RagA family outer membrane protein n=1 Tax=Algoriphagus antarcticus TaxID=238540 RepID=A0A3E0DII6_9BACT|nr:TonB-dependent receptor [Algoriphagus antarcticus]REG81854.1 TonB-linked SusC/RagA family outer membrane protein [Algoriphagus antarcticus]
MKAIVTSITKKDERVKQKIIPFIRRNFGYYLLPLLFVQVATATPLPAEGELIGNKKTESINSGSYLFEIHKMAEFLVVTEADIQVSGTVTDEKGDPLPGASVTVAGTLTGTVTDINGNYTLEVDESATLIFSFIGFDSEEVAVGSRTIINITLLDDVSSLDEIVVVGYGTKKKINLTGAVSTASGKDMANRPVTNVQQSLQGLVSNLTISPNNAGGEPGADMAMSIRGLASFEGSTAPFVLVDGVPMGINDIDPNDIESVSVLKDAASTSIYGARAAYGVILITTKRGSSGSRISYSTNVGFSAPTIWPRLEGGTAWAHALNDARTNFGASPFYPDEAIARLEQNLANPGSAPGMLPNASGDNWNIMNTGTLGVANDGISDLILRDNAPRVKHNLSISGGNESVNYYLSGGFYDEKGLLTFGDESFNRFNVDAKIGAKVTSWMNLDLFFKYKSENEDFPWNQNFGRAWYMNWIGKLKFGTPAKYPGTDIWTDQTNVEAWKKVRQSITDNQMVISPKITLEPIKGWVTTLQLNYTSTQVEDTRTGLQYPWVRPNGVVDFIPQNRESTEYHNELRRNTYLSPNLYSSYSRVFGKHDLQLMVGYQQEEYTFSNLGARSFFLLSDAIPSISTAVGDQLVNDAVGHWSTRSVFGRFNYIFDEKYLLEVNLRSDGSSRFEEDERWGVFPSVSAGWIISEENFFSSNKLIDLLKIRGSYGTLGNQDVANYLFIPTMPIRQTNNWLFGNDRAWTVRAPNLNSVNLSWETVSTIDLGIDAYLLNNRLGFTFGVYETRTSDLVGPGQPLPAVLGSTVPKRNEGEIKTRGWELELSWKNVVSQDFRYEIRGQLADYKSTVVDYNNPTGLLNTFYPGQDLNEIWGYRYDSHYQTQAEISEGVDQSFIYSGLWRTGDFRYKDLNGDGKINVGDNTIDNHGDLDIVGNTTPRYTYGLNLNAQWKNLDVSIFFQGVAKRDWSFGSSSVFRGPAGGPMHNNVLEGHLDYWRDESSVLGANYDAYFPRPYAQFFGENAKNYGRPTDHLMQDASYLRLKNLQIGYSLPKRIAEKVLLTNARIYISGENLLTFTDLMFFDPEALAGRWYGSGDAYPLSRTFSAGLNLNF